MSVSLIISTYNRPDALQVVLDSVVVQERMPDEVLIVDDGSKDDTRILIEQFIQTAPTKVRHIWQPDDGFRISRIRNLGIAASNYDYLIFIDGDIIMHPAFVKGHVDNARANQFIQGSRVLLSDKLTRSSIMNRRKTFSFYESGITNRFNAISNKLLSSLFSPKVSHLKSIRGCNFSAWRQDLIDVNGYNEDFEGWGKEDSELVARLFNKGLKRVNLKFAAVGYHLHHAESNKKAYSEVLARNEAMYAKSRDEGLVFCKNGLDQHLS
jgi:glycosyltransferase involved in cell wall biosynthesis